MSIDRIINVGKYMPTPTDAVYRLTGIVVHHGTSPLSGHYTFIKEDFGIPIQIDDDTFRISNGKHMLTDSYLSSSSLCFLTLRPAASCMPVCNSVQPSHSRTEIRISGR
jgi:hypothetical protein